MLLFATGVFLLAGLPDHDPWRGDDVVTLAVARSLADGSGLLPRLAGELWLGTPPLFHWLAAALGNLFDAVLPWHAAARMASALCLGLGLYLLAIASRPLHGADTARMAPLLAAGTLGLLVPAHEAQPALLGFLAVALQCAGLAHWQSAPRRAPLAVGASLGIGFLGLGVGSLLPMLVLTALVLLHPEWRSRNRGGWGLLLLVAVPLIAAWPLLLGGHDEALLQRWWQSELRGLGGASSLGVKRLEVLVWSSWPVLPLALWLLWVERRQLTHPASYLAFAGIAVHLLLFLRSDEPGQALLPLLAMLTLAAAPAAGRLRRGAANAFDWFGAMTLTLLMALVWLGGIAILTGLPERVAKNFSKPAPGFIPEWSWLAFGIAVAVTLLWLRLLVALPRSPWRAATRWSFGVMITWILLVALWMPWIDYGKSYRLVARDLRQHLAGQTGCIERRGLDEAHRASLHYFAGIRTVPSSARSTDCSFRITRATPGSERAVPGWQLVTETRRPGDRGEVLRLYRRSS